MPQNTDPWLYTPCIISHALGDFDMGASFWRRSRCPRLTIWDPGDFRKGHFHTAQICDFITSMLFYRQGPEFFCSRVKRALALLPSKLIKILVMETMVICSPERVVLKGRRRLFCYHETSVWLCSYHPVNIYIMLCDSSLKYS